MNERALQIRVGALVLTGLVLGAFLILLLGSLPTPFRQQYTVYVRFPRAPGVNVDTPVRNSGIRIGRVSQVKLLEEGGVILTLKIDTQYHLRHSDECRITTGSLVSGDAVVEFVPRGQEAERIQHQAFVSGGTVAADPFETFVQLAQDVQPAIRAIENAGNEVTRLSQKLNTVLGSNDQQIDRLMARAESALVQFQKSMSLIDRITGDEQLQERLHKSLADLPLVFDDARKTLADARVAFDSMKRATEKAEKNLDYLEGFTQPLGENGGRLVNSLTRSLDNMDDLLRELQIFGESLNNGEGSLAKLIHDDELYTRLNRAAGNVEDASRRLRPIMDDVRVFADKVARDPGGSIGAKSLLDRRPSGLKTGVPGL